MKKRLVSLLLALALLVLPVLPAFAAEEDSYTYVALGDSITTGVGLKDTHFSSTAKSYDVQENYHDYSKDCYVARVADALGLDRDHAVNYGMPAAMSSNILDLVRTGSTASGVAYYDLPTLRQELADADLITLLIGSNDTVLQLMGAMGRATNGKATKLLIPSADGHHAGAESPDPPDPEKGPGKPGPDPGRAEGRPEAAGFRHGGDL